MAILTIDQHDDLMDAARLAGEQHFTAYPQDAGVPLDKSAIAMLAADVLFFYDGEVTEGTDMMQYVGSVSQAFQGGFVGAGGIVL